MDNFTQIVGAFVISGFIALTVLAMYVYLVKRISLAPASPANHLIVQRFDSQAELHEYHKQHRASICGRANAAIGRYHTAFRNKLGEMDPVIAKTHAIPVQRFEDLLPLI